MGQAQIDPELSPIAELLPLPQTGVMPVSQQNSAPPSASAEDGSGTPQHADTATLDQSVNGILSQFTGGISPPSLLLAYADWASHLAMAPGKQLDLLRNWIDAATDVATFAGRCVVGAASDPCDSALPHDNRFRAAEWRKPPFNILAHAFLATERWWEQAMSVRGMEAHHRDVTTFVTRQILDIFAPSNMPWTNPVVLERTQREAGLNLAQGLGHAFEDVRRLINKEPPAGGERFQVGKTVATSRGKVVCRTKLAEIIQYSPTTEQVHATPVVIVPAWIMKYYILDLSPENSLVQFLLARGFTVFMVSWKNPGPEDRNVSFDDYRANGVMPAIEAATRITGARKVNAVGYCLGGTLLAASAAAMSRDGDDRLESVSFLAAQADFTEAGELKLFLDESQVSFLEDTMQRRGYLDSRQMAGAFQLLRSNDLIWSRVIRDYLLGERSGNFDILAWNADTTRMPARMHSDYLRRLFLENDLAEGRFEVAGAPVALSDLRVPLFVVGTELDHVAPWRSVYKFNLLTDADVTFLLTSGGHNGGILSVPGNADRHFRVASKAADARYIDPNRWLADTPVQAGSWWPIWTNWLTDRAGPLGEPPPLGRADAGYAPLCDAPGTFVFMT